MKPHKHSELIKAWADGATIQHRFFMGGDIQDWSEWKDKDELIWDTSKWVEYRIKPEPKPDVVKYAYVAMFGMDYLGLNNQISEYANLKLTFGTTGELKSAEVLK